MDYARITVVGIGADGWAGLAAPARVAIESARTIIGSRRQLDLIPDTPAARRRAWPSPIDPLLTEICEQTPDGCCVLASGDPMLHGIGATLARRVGPDRLTIHPHPSAFALACARLGWPAADVALASAVGRPPDVLAPLLFPGRRLIAYNTGTPQDLANALKDRGFGPSRFVVCEQLGGPDERLTDKTAETWDDRPTDPLHAVAVECRGGPGYGRTPGLPDEAYEHDGQLTKWAVRAVTLAALRPGPGLLWDIGGGAGSIAIEWLRADPQATATAIERHPERAARIRTNALRLGVPHLTVLEAEAPDALTSLDPPDAIFIGGGLSAPGLVAACVGALRPGGRIVANAVTLEGEQTLLIARAVHGGSLVRLAVSHAEAVGAFEAWRSQLPVVQWRATA